MDILNMLLTQLASLAGVAAFFAFLINALKQFGIIEDGDAPRWNAALNLIALVVLFVFGKTLNVPGIDQALGQIALLGMLILQLFGQMLVTRAVHYTVRGISLIGTSYSLKTAP